MRRKLPQLTADIQLMIVYTQARDNKNIWCAMHDDDDDDDRKANSRFEASTSAYRLENKYNIDSGALSRWTRNS